MELQEKRQRKAILIFVCCMAAVIITTILVCKIPVVPMCVILLLEVLLAACMHGMPLGVHMMLMMAEIIIGIVCGKGLFLVLCAVIYLAAVLMLGVLFREEKE